jgi:EAL domain-containing protein (putative c-di-GMP-specific phosphodiesterase class I)
MLGTLQKPVLLQTLQEMLKRGMNVAGKLTADELAAAIEQRQLHVYYQPKIARRPAGWIVEGAEALLRWIHPRLGLVMPGDFIPLAEETGLVRELTDYVLEVVIDALARWRDADLGLTAAVNVAPQLLGDFDFPDRLARMLDAKGVRKDRIVLEITESAAMKDPNITMHILARLRLKDIKLAIDDFGIGFSSLKLLYEMPFSELKIDRSFIQDLEHNPEAGTIVNTIVQLAHNLGMQVCVEGVETQAAFDAVAALGCEKIQGFLISRAINADSFERFVREWAWSDRQAHGALKTARR